MATVVAEGIDNKRIAQGWWHYWLTLQLPEEVRQQLFLPVQAGCIASFLAREGMEDTLIRWMQRICSTQRQWSVTLDPVLKEPGGWRLREPVHFQQLQQQLGSLNSYLLGSDCPAIQLGQSVQWRVPDNFLHRSAGSIQFVLEGMVLFRRACYAEEGKQITVFGFRP
ncbi:MAG: hypothetical protein ACKO1T_08115 [Sediminibacterium sp.]